MDNCERKMYHMTRETTQASYLRNKVTFITLLSFILLFDTHEHVTIHDNNVPCKKMMIRVDINFPGYY